MVTDGTLPLLPAPQRALRLLVVEVQQQRPLPPPQWES
jgi:hypothetical protein